MRTTMHHYRSREDEMACGGGASDPYFYLRLSAGSAPYNPIKLEVDVKPDVSRMTTTTPVALQQQQLHQQQQGSPAGGIMDAVELHHPLKEELSATGIGLLALTQLDGYGGYKSYDAAQVVAANHHGVQISADDLDGDRGDVDKVKYSYDRLMYSSDDVKHQVFDRLFFFFLLPIFLERRVHVFVIYAIVAAAAVARNLRTLRVCLIFARCV